MMKKIVYTLMIAAFALTQAACEDYKQEYIDDFSTILYLRNSGEIPLTVYKTGENTGYTVIVEKAGTKLNATTSVNVSVMEDAALEIYNAEHGTSYKKLPAGCYVFNNAQVDFTSADTYKTFKAELVTTEIDKLSASGASRYVLPLTLSNSVDSINSEKQQLFIVPSVVIPLISFEKTGYQLNTVSDGGAAEIELGLPLSLPLENKWTFDCTMNIDETLLNTYNNDNEVDYSLLPANAYTMNSTVGFTPGVSTSKLSVVVKRSGLDYGNYVLPLRLATCSHPTFQIDEAANTCLFGISYVPDESKLSKVALTEAMIDFFPNPTNEGSIAEMLDGKADTYYHSNWSGEHALPHYLDFKLGKESTAFLFQYMTRHNNSNGTPQQISIYGSTDGVTYKKVTTITDGLPTGTGATYKSPVMVGKPFKFLRVSVEKTPNGGSFAMAEFSLFTN